MTKINSKYIKDNVKCVNCGATGNQLKRSHKQSFKSLIDANGDNNPEKFEWRQFECSCGTTTNVLNTATNLVSVSEHAVTPFSSFDFYFQIEEEFCLWMFYKENVNGEVIEDDVRDDMILAFNEFFSKHHMQVDNSMENCWDILFDRAYYNFKNVDELLEKAKEIILKSGATYNPDPDMVDENDPECFELKNAYMPESEKRMIQRKTENF